MRIGNTVEKIYRDVGRDRAPGSQPEAKRDVTRAGGFKTTIRRLSGAEFDLLMKHGFEGSERDVGNAAGVAVLQRGCAFKLNRTMHLLLSGRVGSVSPRGVGNGLPYGRGFGTSWVHPAVRRLGRGSVRGNGRLPLGTASRPNRETNAAIHCGSEG